MANAYFLNHTIDTSTTNNYFNVIWKLTRAMKSSGWTTVYHSDGVTKSNTGDSWGVNVNPADDTYPAFNSAAAWIVMRGPSTIKLNFTTAPGNLVRGESITQAVSGATGELLGIVWDGSTGWAVVMPRTGTFDATNVITGGISGQTFTPTSVQTYVREFMFAKSSANVTSGTIYYICAEQTSESTSLFSTLAASAGCTATIPPGSGGTGNSFPSIGVCCKGAAGSVSHNSFFVNSGIGTYANLLAANATPSSGISADGSFWSLPQTTSSQSLAFGFVRVEDSEPGDVDPYVIFTMSNTTPTTYTNNTTVGGAALFTLASYFSYISSTNSIQLFWVGYVARGVGQPTREKAVAWVALATNSTYVNTGVNTKLSNYPGADSVTPYLREFPLLISNRTTEVWHKGRPRWYFYSTVGAHMDTLDSKRFVVISARNGNTNPSFCVGPWDGSTNPL